MAIDFGWVIQPIPTPSLNTTDLLEYNRTALRAPSPQFTTVWMEDHFQWSEKPTLEAWTTMTFLAAEFPTLRFGNMVLGQSYRNPAMLAKMAATLDYLTGGRVIMGIGAGWKEDEYRAYGYDYPRAGVRIGQLADTIEIMRAMWTQSPATYHGTYYHIETAYCEPRPQRQIPIHVGGSGEKGTLKVVAQYADAWNFATFSGDIAVFRQKLAVLHSHCQTVGRDPAQIQLTYYGIVHLPDDPAEYKPSEGIEVLGPTPTDAIGQLQPFIDAGVTHILVRTLDLQTLERFGAEVAPVLVNGNT